MLTCADHWLTKVIAVVYWKVIDKFCRGKEGDEKDRNVRGMYTLKEDDWEGLREEQGLEGGWGHRNISHWPYTRGVLGVLSGL